MSVKKEKVKTIKRDENGLIEGIDYVYNEDGLIDWRKMVKPEYLVANRQKTQETDVTKIEDKNLLILLGGIKELAQIRGYSHVTYDVVSPSADYVVATCTITWKPNYETENEPVIFSAIGDASPSNTNDFARFFLGPIAENRAFVRCVRNFLKINIVGQEEVNTNNVSDVSGEQVGTVSGVGQVDVKKCLKDLLSERKIPFDKVKNKLIKDNYPNAEEINSVDGISKLKAYELLKFIKSKTKGD